jgi:adenylate cyclase
VSEGDTLFGSVINLTARICARAQPEQILAAPVIKHLCIGKLVRFLEHGPADLKGFDGPVMLHEIAWH